MKSDRRGLTLFALIVLGSLSLGLLADAGHVLWPIVLIVAGAYVLGQAPTLLVKLRSFFSARRAGPDDKS